MPTRYGDDGRPPLRIAAMALALVLAAAAGAGLGFILPDGEGDDDAEPVQAVDSSADG